jgi:tocopherol O-methyltransferase
LADNETNIKAEQNKSLTLCLETYRKVEQNWGKSYNRNMKTSFSYSAKASVREKVQRFYDLGSPYYYKIYGEHIHDGYYVTGRESKEEAQENLIRLLVEKARIKRGARILDVGCGMGGSSIWLAENLGAVTVGITISPVQVEMAKKLAQDRGVKSSFLLMDAEKMLLTGSYDVIWAVAVLSHLRNQGNFLRSATKLLNKRGKFIIFDWMVDEDVVDWLNDWYIKLVFEGMLLSSLYPISTYLTWFIKYGYRITYSEDITDHTIKTWDDALSVIKEPAVWKLAYKVTSEERRELRRFLKSIRPMKLAMQQGKLKSGVIVAEKI